MVWNPKVTLLSDNKKMGAYNGGEPKRNLGPCNSNSQGCFSKKKSVFSSSGKHRPVQLLVNIWGGSSIETLLLLLLPSHLQTYKFKTENACICFIYQFFFKEQQITAEVIRIGKFKFQFKQFKEGGEKKESRN